MIGAGGSALVGLTLLLSIPRLSRAQDTTAAAPHVLSFDVAKVHPFRRSYDVVVSSRDSSYVLGQRDVVLDTSTYSGAPAWLLVETRTGLVPAAESLYVSPELRPLHWSSTLGVARLGAEFVKDSIYGATTGPVGKHNIVLAGRPDLLVSGPMLEALLPALPLAMNWTDSVGVLAVDLATSEVIPAELAVVGEEQLVQDSLTARPAWVTVLRTGSQHALYWIDKETGSVLRIQQSLPAHVGGELEYKLRPE